MRSPFQSYYPLSPDQRVQLWREATIIFDTNALLDLYRYDPEAREVFMQVLETQRERIWIPYQVGLEFQRNRLKIVSTIRGAFDKMRKAADGYRTSVSATIDELKRHPTIDAGLLQEIVDDAHQRLVHHLELARSAGSAQMPASDLEDAIWERLTVALDGCVGERPSSTRIAELHAEAQRRIDEEQPPGYKDRDKSVPDRYGDYLVWREILDFASPNGSVIFVTGDRKEDWWRKHEGRHLGARIELLDEFHEASEGVIAFHTPDEFLRHARDEFELGDVPERILVNVEEVGRIDAEPPQGELLQAASAFDKEIAAAASTISTINSHLTSLGLPTEGGAHQRLNEFISARRKLDELMADAVYRKRMIERRMNSADPQDHSFDSLIDDHRSVSFEIDDLSEESAYLDSQADIDMDSKRIDEYRRLLRARDMQWERLREAERVRLNLHARVAATAASSGENLGS